MIFDFDILEKRARISKFAKKCVKNENKDKEKLQKIGKIEKSNLRRSAKEEKMSKNKQKKPNIGKYLKKYKFWIGLYILLTIVAGVCDIFLAILLARVIVLITPQIVSATVTIPPDFHKALIVGAIAISISVLQRGCWFAISWIYSKYSNKIMSELNLDLAKQAFKLNSKTYNDHDTGTFVQRIVDDPARIIDSLSSIVDIVFEMITSVVMLVYITTLNGWVSLFLVLIVIVGFVLEYYRVKVRRKNRFIVRQKNDKIYSLTTEIVRSEKDVKSLGLEQKLSEVSKTNYEDYRRSRFKMDTTDLCFWSSRNFIIGVGTLLVLLFAIYLMDLGLLTLATFMIIYSNRNSLWSLVSGVGSITNCIVDVKVCHKRMFSLFDEEEFVTERFGEKNLEKVVGEVEFKDVSFTFREYEYPDYSKKDDKQENNGEGIFASHKLKKARKKAKNAKKEIKLVSENQIFDKLSFKIHPNTTVAFVGKSGSGKSTILNLMSKMYEADSGQVLIDGVDIKDLNKETLRSTISLVNQFPYIFDMTIKENLLLAKADATDEEIWDSIKKASLDEFVNTLPKKLETKVGESGIKLSGGQKQRLAIARALLRNSNIIIFDESTSSLDNFAQEEVKKSIDGLKGKSTIIIVAHRLSTIKNVDHIFFLDGGVIVDEGAFDELFERNDKFKAMFLAENI